MEVISKALSYRGPHSEVTSGNCEVHLAPNDIHLCLSPQVPIALLLLSYYQNQYSSAAENLVGYMLSHSQTKRKCKLNTEMPQIGDLGKISTPGLCLLLPFLSLALGIKVTHKRNRRGSFASEKNHSLGDFLSNVLL